ncbi:MAG: HAD family hydrolase [Bacteroidales bacterium]|jgi:putative hydrolase of the HAD superfamily
MKKSVKAIIFDWGDTVMRDFNLPGPMYLWKTVAWVPGAEIALKWLHPKYHCIIATSAEHSNTNDMINALRLVGAEIYFDHFFSQIELGVKKPDPEFFVRTAELSGYKPHECVMIGNLYEKDIIGAKEAGLFTVFFNEHQLEGPFPKADFIIHHMSELTTLFNA